MAQTQGLLTSVQADLDILRTIEQELQAELFEREDPIRAALIAILARAHMVLLGPPGTGKSQMIRLISERFCDPTGAGLTYFVYLLTRFTTPEEMFGPLDIPRLQQGIWERLVDGKLPSAHIAFLDEIFKSSSAVLNILLTILNERAFDNGRQRLTVPLISLFGASNEMPQEAADLEALWDRFLIRLEVNYLSEGNFEKLLLAQVAAPAKPTTMSQASLTRLQDVAAQIPIPPAIMTALVSLRRELDQKKGIKASDRRWVQCLSLLRAHALMEGRDVVEEDDLIVLRWCLWKEKEDQAEISRMCNKLANPLNAKAAELKDNLAQLMAQVTRDLAKHPNVSDEKEAMERTTIIVGAITKAKAVVKALGVLQQTAIEQGRQTRRIDQALAQAESSLKELVTQGGF
jgi:MoxR-like ATPase